MTASELAAYVGKVGALRTAEGLSIPVEIMFARDLFGRIDLYVTPQTGEGSAWVSSDRVKIEGGTK